MRRLAGSVVTTTIEGREIRFFVANEQDVIQRHHAQGEFYEPEELAIIGRHCPAGAHFVDIGANVGNHAIHVAAFLAPGSVLVLEPNPPAAEILRLNVLLNGLSGVVDTSLLGIGLAGAEGVAAAVGGRNNLGGTRMVPGAPDGTIPLRTGDSLLAGRAVNVLKIDVEGMEMEVLGGLAGTIATRRPAIFIEVHNRNAREFRAWAAAQGYRITETFRRYPSNENFMAVPG